MNLLQIVLSVLLKVFRQAVLDGLLEFVLDFSTHVAHLYLGAFTYLVALLYQLLTALACGLWKIEANHLAIVLGSDANIAVHDTLLDILDGLLVPGTDGRRAR